jgi:hypothetical protein
MRLILALVTVACMLFAWAGWFRSTVWERRRCAAEIGGMLSTLPRRRPPEMTPKQWENAVAWTTSNLFGTSKLYYAPVDLPAMQRFERELKVKLAGKVDFNTILWIWDRFAELSPSGQRYNEIYRQQMIEDTSLEGSKHVNYR